MNETTAQKIKRLSPYVAAYVSTIKEIRSLTKQVTGDTRTELLAIADRLEEFPVELFESPLHRVYSLLQKGVRANSIRNYAKNRRMNYHTLLETIQAIHEGGIQVPGVQRIEREPPPFSRGVGARITNKGKSNIERAKESFHCVQTAVSSLKEQIGDKEWNGMKIRARIGLIQEKTKELRGVSVHPHTLYKKQFKELWWSKCN